MKNYFTKEDGQGLVEYGLIIALVAIVSVSSLGVLSGGLVDKFDLISNAMSTEELEDGSYVISKEDGFGFRLGNLAWGRLEGGDTGDKKDIIIPNSMNGTTIKGIWQDVFNGKGLTKVVFDEGSALVQIHNKAFKDNELSNLNLPNGLERIDGQAFYNNKLTEITLPNSVQIIEQNAFGGNIPGRNNIQKITIGAKVSVAENSFANKGFKAAYDSGGAGTYVYANGNWAKQKP